MSSSLVFNELVDWRYSHSCWYLFSTALWTIAPLTFSLFSSSPPPHFPNWISIWYFTRIQYVRGGVWGHRKGGALLSISLICLRCRQTNWAAVTALWSSQKSEGCPAILSKVRQIYFIFWFFCTFYSLVTPHWECTILQRTSQSKESPGDRPSNQVTTYLASLLPVPD